MNRHILLFTYLSQELSFIGKLPDDPKSVPKRKSRHLFYGMSCVTSDELPRYSFDLSPQLSLPQRSLKTFYYPCLLRNIALNFFEVGGQRKCFFERDKMHAVYQKIWSVISLYG